MPDSKAMTSHTRIDDLDRVDQTIDVDAGFAKVEHHDNGTTIIHDGRLHGPVLTIRVDGGVAGLAIASKIEHAGETVEVVTYFQMDEEVASAVARSLSVPTEIGPAVDGPEEGPRYVAPRNHIHIPNLRHNNGTGRNILIDGHPVAVLEDGFELNGVGDRNNLTTVTLTIVPDKITVDGDMRDSSSE